MNILLLGASGQVGWELQRALAPLGTLHICNRQAADLSRPETLPALADSIQPRLIVNAAAYTAVDQAESDIASARLINTESVSVLAEAARRHNAWLVHYSTDYVFDGSKQGAYCEDDSTAPLNVYGKTKLEGERMIATSGCDYLIFRTSWVYAARGANFAKTMLRLAREREELQVVADQIGAPTHAELIADITALTLQRLRHDPALAAKAKGIYHLTAGGETSWHAYAQFIVERATTMGMTLKVTPEHVQAISAAEYPAVAKRPLNSLLDTNKLRSTFSLELPHWRYHAQRMLYEII